MKSQNFIVEVIQMDDRKMYVIRDIKNGSIFAVCEDSDSLAKFFNDL